MPQFNLILNSATKATKVILTQILLIQLNPSLTQLAYSATIQFYSERGHQSYKGNPNPNPTNPT
ncbi:MAG: hypothetical protein K2P88_00090 [Chitinophagaceae bacterium]|nr:hypothetical protein [Chitinophagaceae bacterium]